MSRDGTLSTPKYEYSVLSGMSHAGYVLECQACDWEAEMPTRQHAEHLKLVHERENEDHVVIIDPD